MTNIDNLKVIIAKHRTLLSLLSQHDTSGIPSTCITINAEFDTLLAGWQSMEDLANDYGKKLCNSIGSNFTSIKKYSFFEPTLLSNSYGRQQFLACISQDLYCNKQYQQSFGYLESSVKTIESNYVYTSHTGTYAEFVSKLSAMTRVETTGGGSSRSTSESGTTTTVVIVDTKLMKESLAYLSDLSSAINKSKLYTPLISQLKTGWQAIYDADVLETQLSNLINNVIDSTNMSDEELLEAEKSVVLASRYNKDISGECGFSVAKHFREQKYATPVIVKSARVTCVDYFKYIERMTIIQNKWLLEVSYI